MPFTFKCYQDNFMIQNLNIGSFGDCLGSVIICMAFALLVELSRGIDLYLRNYSIPGTHLDSNRTVSLSVDAVRKRRFILHLLRTLVHLVQMGLSYILMLMVMNNFAGFFLSAVIALGIGYYLLNGVHPYTRSANSLQVSHANSDFTSPTDLVNEDDTPSLASTTTSSHQRTMPINT